MGAEVFLPNPWLVLPFGLLLVAMAVGPVACPALWERHYAKVAYLLGAVTLGYYLFGLQAYGRVLYVAHEYISFIVLIGSLFVVAGGLHINVKGEATPAVNTAFLGLGALVANVLGTTGASMLLIRPWIRMNKYRITGHHIVFFIFIVSNVGGCLTPIGDPPLFLGYLKGIPFWWVAQHCWPMWLVGVGFLLALFFFLDSRNYQRAPKAVRAQLTEPHDQWRFEGAWNLVFLVVILAAVFINRPALLREVLMVAAAAASFRFTRKEIHRANHFDFHPIKEVAILFVGVFATMIPALDWLQAHAGRMANPSAALFYWGTGGLSSVLDNAPTYLGFLSATFGLFVDPATVGQVQQLIHTQGVGLAALTGPHAEQIRHTFEALQKYHGAALAAGHVSPDQIAVAFLVGNNHFNLYLVAISIGAVFFGANTYIGNGPNFMVKAIAQHQKAHPPNFLSFVWRYTLPYMGPLWVLIWLLFFRG